jgi:Ca-activated chloride channel family protein
LGFQFGSPVYLWALVLAPLLLAFVLTIRRRRSRYDVAYSNVGVLGSVLKEGGTSWQRRVPLVLLCLSVAAMAFALARPHVALGSPVRGTTIELVVDVSGSMQATDIAPSRLAAAVAAMHAFANTLPRSAKLGLVATSDLAQSIDPPTTDRNAVNSSLDILTPHGGTALAAGVEQAVKVVMAVLAAEGVNPAPGRTLPGAIVVATDGGQNRGTVGLLQAAQLAHAVGVRIYGVTVGTPDGVISQGPGLVKAEYPVPADPGTVALLARATGGQAFTALSAAGLDTIYRQLATTVQSHSHTVEITSWFELAAALLLVVAVLTLRLQGGALP